MKERPKEITCPYGLTIGVDYDSRGACDSCLLVHRKEHRFCFDVHLAYRIVDIPPVEKETTLEDVFREGNR